MNSNGHDSDCATHNEPAYPAGPCDCIPTQAMCRAAVVYMNGADVYEKLPLEVLEIEEKIYAEVWKAMHCCDKAFNVEESEDMTTIQKRLRDGASIARDRRINLDYAKVAEEAADKIDALEAEIQILTAEREVYAAAADRAIAQIDALTKDVAEYRKCADDAAMKHKVERDELMADKEVLLGHMTTIRNVTNDPAISNLANLVLERMAQKGEQV